MIAEAELIRVDQIGTIFSPESVNEDVEPTADQSQTTKSTSKVKCQTTTPSPLAAA